MKIIDLLNKITNGEELPEKIEYNGITYELDIYGGWQYYIDRVNSITLLERINSVTNLDCEVEIIEEEDKKIEKIKSLNNVGKCQNVIDFKDKQHLNNCILKDKINEIIDYIDAGDDKE